MFGPLEFCESFVKTPLKNQDSDIKVPCVLCDKQYIFPGEQEICLSHIYENHNLIISDADEIADLPKYLLFWHSQFRQGDFKIYCSTFLINGKGSAELEKEEFFILSDTLELDNELRNTLQKEKLEHVLEQQKFEREDGNFQHGCFFCRNEIGPTRAYFINHLLEKHNLNLGRPDNLVFLDKLISVIEKKLENLQCIYCEKVFKDRLVLKEHMRKKLHKRINPKNTFYDQFFVINYMESKKPQGKKYGDKLELSSEEECDWSDWEENEEISLVCLFCPKAAHSWQGVLCHMISEHHFQYEKNTNSLSFYDQVKIVNYIRRQIYNSKCVICNVKKDNNKDLLEHMESEKHLVMPEKHLWNHPEFYFPTYENDAFLCHLDDEQPSELELSDAISDISVR